MTPERPRPPWGWTAHARGLLILMMGPMALMLARAAWYAPTSVVVPYSLVADANSAPLPVLNALPGLGPVLSGRIVEARERGPIRSLGDLDRRVKGIGPVKAAALKPFLRFEPQAR